MYKINRIENNITPVNIEVFTEQNQFQESNACPKQGHWQQLEEALFKFEPNFKIKRDQPIT